MEITWRDIGEMTETDFSKKKICPKCGSEDISSIYSEKTFSLECDDCNFKWRVKND